MTIEIYDPVMKSSYSSSFRKIKLVNFHLLRLIWDPIWSRHQTRCFPRKLGSQQFFFCNFFAIFPSSTSKWFFLLETEIWAILFFSMAEKYEILFVKFNGKNYHSWEFQIWISLKGKDLWGHIATTIPKPAVTKDSETIQNYLNRKLMMLKSRVDSKFCGSMGCP